MDQRESGRTLWWLSGLLLLVVVGFGLAWWFLASKPRTAYSPQNTLNSVLVSGNAYFAEAERLGKLIGATATDTNARVELYQAALALSEDKAQEGQIKYKIAVATVQKGEYLAAIPLYKEIAADPEYTVYTRAYAVQNMANLFYLYHDAQIPDVTFADEPYRSMLAPGDTGLSYRRLFEYASSFYPLAIPESRIADWYAAELVGLYRDTAAPDPTAVRSHMDQVARHLENARKDIARVSIDPNARVDIPAALLRIALVRAKLASLGLSSLEETEKAFNEAHDASLTILGDVSPYWYYHYANFLRREYGTSREDDIRAMLSNLYNGKYGSHDPVVSFLKNEVNNTVGVKSSIAALAGIDSKFRDFLISLGWTEADFK